MKRFIYMSGEEVKKGDQIMFHGQPAEVEFVVSEKIGDPVMDWYVDEFPEGGVMIIASDEGNVFLTNAESYEDLEFVSRVALPGAPGAAGNF